MPDLMTSEPQTQEASTHSVTSSKSSFTALTARFFNVTEVDFLPYFDHLKRHGRMVTPLVPDNVQVFCRLEETADRRLQRFVTVAYVVDVQSKQVFFNYTVHHADCVKYTRKTAQGGTETVERRGVFVKLTPGEKNSHRHTALQRLFRRFYKTSYTRVSLADGIEACHRYCQRHPDHSGEMPKHLKDLRAAIADVHKNHAIMQEFIRRLMKTSKSESGLRLVKHNKISVRVDPTLMPPELMRETRSEAPATTGAPPPLSASVLRVFPETTSLGC